jgi:hypothetical protein
VRYAIGGQAMFLLLAILCLSLSCRNPVCPDPETLICDGETGVTMRHVAAGEEVLLAGPGDFDISSAAFVLSWTLFVPGDLPTGCTLDWPVIMEATAKHTKGG